MERKFERRLEALNQVFDFIHEFEVDQDLAPQDARNIGLIVDELFTNCVRHGGGSQMPVEIHLLRSDQDTVQVTILDPDASFFDITQFPKADAISKEGTPRPLDRITIGGLGLHLVKATSQHIAYQYKDRASETQVEVRVVGQSL
jgi:anti-sigma regulatory factor (Ser/Thr protein kinase)